jgi:membrane protein
MSDTKPGLKDRLTARLDAARQRYGLLNHAVEAWQHYGNVQGNVLASAVTYFGYLSFFPVLALGFAVIGFVARGDPEGQDAMLSALQQVLPGLVGDEGSDAPIKISTFTDAAGTATVFGIVGLLYTGLGWLSGLREALQAVFGVPARDTRNFLMGKLYDLLTLLVLGAVLFVSLGTSVAVTASLEKTLEWLHLDGVAGMGLLAWLVAVALGVAATTALFFVMFKLLPDPDLPPMALVKGALFGALGFEVLKALANLLIAWATQNPAFALLGVSLILLLYINYFSRIILLAAAWAAMSAEGKPVLARREVEEVERIIGGDTQVPAAVGTFREASTAEGAAAPWPPDLPTDERNSRGLSPEPPPAQGSGDDDE